MNANQYHPSNPFANMFDDSINYHLDEIRRANILNNNEYDYLVRTLERNSQNMYDGVCNYLRQRNIQNIIYPQMCELTKEYMVGIVKQIQNNRVNMPYGNNGGGMSVSVPGGGPNMSGTNALANAYGYNNQHQQLNMNNVINMDARAATAASNIHKQVDQKQKQGGYVNDKVVTELKESTVNTNISPVHLIGKDATESQQIQMGTIENANENKITDIYTKHSSITYVQNELSTIEVSTIEFNKLLFSNIEMNNYIRCMLPEIFNVENYCYSIKYNKVHNYRLAGMGKIVYNVYKKLHEEFAVNDLNDLSKSIPKIKEIINKLDIIPKEFISNEFLNLLDRTLKFYMFRCDNPLFYLHANKWKYLSYLLGPNSSIANERNRLTVEEYHDAMRTAHGNLYLDCTKNILRYCLQKTFVNENNPLVLNSRNKEIVAGISSLPFVIDDRYIHRDICSMPSDIFDKFVDQFTQDYVLRRIPVHIVMTNLNINTYIRNHECTTIVNDIDVPFAILRDIIVNNMFDPIMVFQFDENHKFVIGAEVGLNIKGYMKFIPIYKYPK